MAQEYAVVYSDDFLAHHGVKGQKWGVRRYENFDGSLTRKGLARYKKSSEQYNKDRDTYKAVKIAYKKGLTDPKGNRVTVPKSSVVNARINMKQSKRRMDKDYKHLALDKRADKGKELYSQGYRITGKQKVIRAMETIGASTIGAVALAKYAGGKVPLGATGITLQMPYKLRNVLTKYGNQIAIAGAGLTAASVAGDIVTRNKDRNLRAYYTHTSNY